MYTEKDLAMIAKRQNNQKRNYLVVNPLQGKHIPVSPGKCLEMFERLAEEIKTAYPGEKLLLIGFAETATAIGAAAAAALGCGYMQTTREAMADVDWLYFTESHSHATEQKLVRGDLQEQLPRTDRIVFVEDEVTTGNTILKIVQIIRKLDKGQVKFSVASLLNGMDKESLERYEQEGIRLHYLVKTDHSKYPQIAGSASGDGCYVKTLRRRDRTYTDIQTFGGLVDTRRYTDGSAYARACQNLWLQVNERYSVKSADRILVLGTEEFMYPGLYVASKMEEKGCFVRYHATTRSPIEVSTAPDYPLHTRYELKSFYDPERITYIYDLDGYDKVFVITENRPENQAGAETLLHGLEMNGNREIHLIKWETGHEDFI